MPAEKFDFRNAQGHQFAALLRPAGRAGTGGGVVWPLLHLRQRQQAGR
jgi:hypothetical protein